MNGIIGMTGLAARHELTAEQREYMIHGEGVGRIRVTCSNDISISRRVEAHQLTLEPILYARAITSRELLKPPGVRAARKQIEFFDLPTCFTRAVASAETGPACRCSSNLVGNAIKFTDRGQIAVQAYVE